MRGNDQGGETSNDAEPANPPKSTTNTLFTLVDTASRDNSGLKPASVPHATKVLSRLQYCHSRSTRIPANRRGKEMMHGEKRKGKNGGE